MKRKCNKILLPIGVWLILLSAALWLVSLWAALIGLAFSLVLMGVALGYLNHTEQQLLDQMDDVLHYNTLAASGIMDGVDIPALIFDEKGRILWGNEAFQSFGEHEEITRLLPEVNPKYPAKAQEIELAGQVYQAMTMPVVRENAQVRRLTFQYWLDRTEALHYKRLYEEQMPTVALIHIDNYEELMADQQFERNSVLTEVERRISAFVTSIEGVYRQYDNARYFVVFEQQKLSELEKYRFALLDSVREIKTGADQPVTLSIAVGVASRILQSDESARQAMELALGRGGDQAVVKRGTAYAFYGGKRQVSTRQSKVKIRLFAKALKQLFENAGEVYVMGHRQSDMDCVGAALGLIRCAASTGCKGYLVLDGSNTSIRCALEEMAANPEYADTVVSAEHAVGTIRSTSVLIIVDTQRESSMIAPELIKRAGKVVVIDHHRKSVDSLEGITLSHLEAGASSACEMVTEILQYFEDVGKPAAFECSALLAGIAVDTKHFVFNTGARTFEAASYLRRNGADTRMIKEMFQDDMQTYRNRTRVVQQAQMIWDGVALAVCPEEMPNASLIAAQAADSLISIRGINASFVLARMGERIMVSGRSLGEINVQVILERLGGGGHLTVAGAQLDNVDMDGAVKLVTNEVRNYLKEAEIE